MGIQPPRPLPVSSHATRMQVRNVVQRSSFDLPDAAVSKPQTASSTGREKQTGRDAILCSRLKGHGAATTCALVTSDAGEHIFRMAGRREVREMFWGVSLLNLAEPTLSDSSRGADASRLASLGSGWALYRKGCGSDICVYASKANQLSFAYHPDCRLLRRWLLLAGTPISP